MKKKEIGLKIDNAIKALQGSLKNTDDKIASLKNQSMAFSFIGFIILILIVLAIIVFLFSWVKNPQSVFISHFITLIENTKGLSFLLVTFPTLIVFFIGLGMLKHSNKLSSEFLHYAKMKHKIELYSGLLEAAQHTAASIKDPDKAETYVEETFTKIRDKLLDSKVPEDTKQIIEKDEPVSIKELAELIKIIKP